MHHFLNKQASIEVGLTAYSVEPYIYCHYVCMYSKSKPKSYTAYKNTFHVVKNVSDEMEEKKIMNIKSFDKSF